MATHTPNQDSGVGSMLSLRAALRPSFKKQTKNQLLPQGERRKIMKLVQNFHLSYKTQKTKFRLLEVVEQ